MNTYPICDSPLQVLAQRSFARLQKSRPNHRSYVRTEVTASHDGFCAGTKAIQYSEIKASISF